MSIKLRNYTGLSLGVTVMFVLVAARCGMCVDDPWDWNKGTGAHAPVQPIHHYQTSLPRLFGNTGIRFFQIYVSPADGDRCSYFPSCSEYAHLAMQKHGLIMGSIMSADRLMRDYRYTNTHYPVITVNGKSFYYDPVFMNDYWWVPRKSETKATGKK